MKSLRKIILRTKNFAGTSVYNLKKEGIYMTKKIFLRFSPLICLLLAFIFILSPSISPISAYAGAALLESDGNFDYAAVMAEPKAENSEYIQTSLTDSQLRSLKLYPGGIPFGVKFMTEGILIVGLCEVDQGTKKINPANDAGLRKGDRIISVDGKTLLSAEELTAIVEKSEGRALPIVYSRGGVIYNSSLTPAFSKKEGCYKTGLYVKDNGAGIGTVTYIDPKTLSFGGLGHGICESDGGRLIAIQRGSVVDVTINGAVIGQSGAPGEVKGSFRPGKTGSLLKNTNCGVYGIYASLPSGLPSEPLSLCLRNDLREGKAYIYCTLDASGPRRYEIEISNIDRSAREGKCFSIKVTDPELLRQTGGIVQGMSGSPIIQNGKLAGAVTHVLINDPTSGYGIFIENMLNAAQMPQARAA